MKSFLVLVNIVVVLCFLLGFSATTAFSGKGESLSPSRNAPSSARPVPECSIYHNGNGYSDIEIAPHLDMACGLCHKDTSEDIVGALQAHLREGMSLQRAMFIEHRNLPCENCHNAFGAGSMPPDHSDMSCANCHAPSMRVQASP